MDHCTPFYFTERSTQKYIEASPSLGWAVWPPVRCEACFGVFCSESTHESSESSAFPPHVSLQLLTLLVITMKTRTELLRFSQLIAAYLIFFPIKPKFLFVCQWGEDLTCRVFFCSYNWPGTQGEPLTLASLVLRLQANLKPRFLIKSFLHRFFLSSLIEIVNA